MQQSGLFGLSEHGDPLEQLGGIFDFETFRPTRLPRCPMEME